MAQYSFAGGERLVEDANLETLKRIAALPSTKAFFKLAVDRIATLLADELGLDSRPPAISALRPLVSDWLGAESLGSFGLASSNRLDFVIALRLDAQRTQVWRDHLSQALGEPGETIRTGGFSGWSWSGAGESNSFWLVPAREWLVVGRGNSLLPLQVKYLEAITRQGYAGSPLKENLLEADLDVPRWSPGLTGRAPLFKPAHLRINVAAKADHFDIAAHAVYPEAIPWTSQPWQIPSEWVRSPLISFTAGRDVAAFLHLGPELTGIEHSPLTNQFCMWALGQLVFQTSMAWPVPNGSNALETLATNLPEFNRDLQRFNGSQLGWVPNRSRLIFSNLGIVVPSIEAGLAKEGQFLLMSVFPLGSGNQPAPEELWKQIAGRPDLVYYDWESTGPRLQQWRLLNPLLLHPSREGSDETVEAMVAKENWLNGIGSPKGNAVTIMTRTSPNELSLVRTAPLGLTGIEWIWLSDWITRAAPR